MAATAGTPRNIIGIVIIALVLGAAPLMLWMGRWRMALVYLVLGIALLAVFFAAVVSGHVPMDLFRDLDPSTAALIAYVPATIAGLVHGLAIQGSALGRPWYSRWYVALPSVLVLSLAAAFGIRTFLFQPFSTPSQSMEPSLMLGDYFFASKTTYLSRDPARGEIAVFRLPADPSIVYVKRVIGLPGDRVQMIDGVLNINGEPVGMERVDVDPVFTQGGTAMLYRETLPGGSAHVIADTEAQSPGDATEEFVVPPGQYFMMGDNRDNSQDSRYAQVGFVPRENFIGPFAFRIWNDQGVPLAGRPQ